MDENVNFTKQTHSASIFEELIAASILGTERRPFTIPQLSGALSDIASKLDTTNQEKLILSLSAVISAYENAGKLPDTGEETQINECEPDPKPCISQRACQMLSQLLEGRYQEVLQEFMAAVANIGKRLPEDKLPALLDMGKDKRSLRKVILPVIGRRGQWLSALNPDWAYVGGANDESVWETGSREARAIILREMRELNPAYAREMITSTWNEEPHEERAAFIETLEIGLSMDDEGFLENALSDRRKEVRTIAARLLVRLQDSGLCKRMIERLSPLIGVSSEKGGWLSLGRKTLKLEVTLPESSDRSMVRDGIEQKPPQGKGEKAWWLQQMVASVPPSYWCETWQATPQDILDTAMKNEWKSELINGFAEAALRTRDADWAQTILHQDLGKVAAISVEPFLKMLTNEHAEALIGRMLPSDQGLNLLYEYKQPWSHGFSMQVLDILQHRGIKIRNWGDWQIRGVLYDFARFISPTVFEEAISRLAGVPGDDLWGKYIADFLNILQFRFEMHKAIEE